MAYPQHFPYGIADFEEPVTLRRDDGTPVTVHFHPPERCPDCQQARLEEAFSAPLAASRNAPKGGAPDHPPKPVYDPSKLFRAYNYDPAEE